jgi:hypothetical protein
MTKKTAELSAGLVAIKGAAVPPPDMHTRAPLVRPDVSAPVAEAVAPRPARESSPAHKAEREASLTPLNFRIPASFRREFKSYAASHDLKLNELLRLSFEAYRREMGD